ncbi:MAG: ATP-binding cassette domain-containing protein [Treponema sp.]|jgi:ATP-binding cassette subfamily C protein|nr:ATP-binding cassette domain-containing protein [Treponema sp.]
MLLISKALLKMAKGLWLWIAAIVGLKILVLAGIALFSWVLSDFLGSMADSPLSGSLLSGALRRAFFASLMVLAGEVLIGEAEYRCTAKARLSLRRRIFSKVLQLDVGSVEKIGLSQAVAAAVDGVESMQVYYSKYLPSLFYCFFAPVFLFFRLRESSFPAALLLLIVSIVIFPANNLFRKIIKELKGDVWGSFRELTGYYLESLQGLSTLKLFNQDGDRSLRLRDKAENFNRNLMAMIKNTFVSFLFSDGLIYLSVFISVLLVCGQLVRGEIALGDGIMVLMLGYGFFASIRQLMFSAHQALTGIAAAETIAGILDIDTKRPFLPFDRTGGEKDIFSGIRVKGVSYRYPGRDTVIRGLDMEIPKNKVTALVGPSGSGKSTIAALLLRFFDPPEGGIDMEGIPYLSRSPEELREKIVMVPQQVGIFSGTIAENLRIAAPQAEDAALIEALTQVRLGDWFSKLPQGLGTDVGDGGAKLSGGQKQKLGIARVLLRRTPYIVFDEAASGVDVESEGDIWACIAGLARTRTLLIISHRLRTIRDADSIYVLSRGGIAESGNHEELMKNRGIYYNLVREQEILEFRGTGCAREAVL